MKRIITFFFLRQAPYIASFQKTFIAHILDIIDTIRNCTKERVAGNNQNTFKEQNTKHIDQYQQAVKQKIERQPPGETTDYKTCTLNRHWSTIEIS